MSSKPSEHDSAVISERKDRAVLCAKCEHLNAWGQNQCKRCGSRLYIACVDCGHKNERVRSRCSHCNRRLHFSLPERLLRRIRGHAVEITGLQIVIFFIGVLFAFLLIFVFSSVSLPKIF